MAREEEQSVDDSQHHSCSKVKHQSNNQAACIEPMQISLLLDGTKAAYVLHDSLDYDVCFALGM